MDERDIDKVAEAFDRLLAHVGRTCDADEPQQVEADAADLYATVGAW